MPEFRWKRAAGTETETYMVFTVLILAFLLPTIALVFFMTQAVRNERLAIRQKLMDAYENTFQLASHNASVSFFHDYFPQNARSVETTYPAELFPLLMSELKSDSVVIFDHNGVVAYPDFDSPREQKDALPPEDMEAGRVEQEGDFAKAAALYSQAADEATTEVSRRASLLRGKARSLLRAGKEAEAVAVLIGPLADRSLREACDSTGRLIQPNSTLLAAELLAEKDPKKAAELVNSLSLQLNTYKPPHMPGAQRLFLMDACKRLASREVFFPTLEAERLARRWLDSGGTVTLSRKVEHVTLENGVWSLPVGLWLTDRNASNNSAIGYAVALHTSESLRRILEAELGKELPAGVYARVYPPGAIAPSLPGREGMWQSSRDPLLVNEFDSLWLPGWFVALYPTNHVSLQEEAGKRASLYVWIGMFAVCCIAGTIMVGGKVLLRQARIARLKNDLTATVTHELKTPISSMRLLVDTLRDNPGIDEGQRSEYLELIARENARLSRLIDNFLTFSRMERNRQSFTFEPVVAAEVVREATEAAGDKLRTRGSSLDIQSEENVPPVFGDKDALVTVVLNLLENAWKYTGDRKIISVRVFASANEVCIEVADNGAGIPLHAQKRVFEKFYQVDESLSRETGGCGLGLSIVKSIVTAHGGRVSLVSDPGAGSRFTVCLPAYHRAKAGETHGG